MQLKSSEFLRQLLAHTCDIRNRAVKPPSELPQSDLPASSTPTRPMPTFPAATSEFHTGALLGRPARKSEKAVCGFQSVAQEGTPDGN